MVDITEQLDGDVLTLKIFGEVDASSSIYLDKAIQQALDNNHKKIMADLSGLEYISSAGLGVFMSYIEDFKNESVEFVIFGVSENVKNVFGILGLDSLMTICPSVEEAKQKLDGI
ncbi:anti-sigma factor antagonist [Fulvitalea axinellae]|uniref:Anti-sigma factor antagonist n=1 Tax=Fulvitalea axinellae TaxID=1182444 RepID=A0AAU9CFS9_9BACT|nr:anti-sigma factor antagonist [Fulvitalea axinellae]